MLVSDSGPVSWVQAAIQPWIDDPARDTTQLERWLCGRDFPPVGPEEEPYIWLLRAIPRGAARPSFETELTRSAVALVERASELRETPEGEQVLYNLLGLCAGLRGRDYLARPLLRLLETGALDGLSYRFNPLNSMLLPALTYNQRDNTLQGVWEAMVRGAPHPVLGGNPSDAFEGIVHMPPSESGRGTPAREAIGFGLTHLLRFFDSRPNRVPLLRRAFDRVESRYPDYHWRLEWIRFSDRYGWPRWTDVALPDLAVSVGDQRYVTWCHVIELLKAQFEQVETLQQWAQGRFCEIHLPPNQLAFYVKVAATSEKYRRNCSRGGEDVEKGIISAICEELKYNQAAQRVQQANAKAAFGATCA